MDKGISQSQGVQWASNSGLALADLPRHDLESSCGIWGNDEYVVGADLHSILRLDHWHERGLC